MANYANQLPIFIFHGADMAKLPQIPQKNQKFVYFFEKNNAEGDAKLRNTLGGKGANLAEMCNIGLPVPPGFTIITDVCVEYYNNDKQFPANLKTEILENLKTLEAKTAKKFGSPQNPLLVSVRSGARASMPGMMDTVLNLGLNDETVLGLKTITQDGRFAYDSYRRFIQMYANVVLNCQHHFFEDALEINKEKFNKSQDNQLSESEWQQVIADYKDLVESQTGEPFPQDPMTQLWGAIRAVFDSWMSKRAITYRALNDIPSQWGTAVNIQSMVFGNMGDDCATGVAFTRDPSTGENIFYGEFLINAQGEDVVAGIRTPQQLTIAGKKARGDAKPAMEEAMPEVFAQLAKVRGILEKHYGDMQDIEFTVENGQLYMLQTRDGKRTTEAALKIAVDMVNEGLITKEIALMRLNPASLDQILHPIFDPKATKKLLCSGLPASPGAATGIIVLNADDAENLAKAGHRVILVRFETSPEDIHGMFAAQGIITVRGGMTSHAAVVARGMGRACVCGIGDIHINETEQYIEVAGNILKSGDYISIDGGKGEVYIGKVPTIQPHLSHDFEIIIGWADSIRQLKIRTNADTPDDTATARKFGAEGIGLCRTEHMFFEGNRITAMRAMILADNENDRKKALDKILPMQQADFEQIFTIMAGFPVTVRLLDPPLHEFLPKKHEEFEFLAKNLGVSIKKIEERAKDLHEANPMLGHRGCRLLNSYPEIAQMQAEAIFRAAASVYKLTHKMVDCEIMIPLVGMENELSRLKEVIISIAHKISKETAVDLQYKIGTMIELPRAALIADKIAEFAEFFSFGTNDLTQTTYGLSRDDAGSFMGEYQQNKLIDFDPFATLDIVGVGELMKIAKERGQKTRHDLKLGICGEHGGDPKSIVFCHDIGLNYVSCSPFRVPIARLTAAQAQIKNPRKIVKY